MTDCCSSNSCGSTDGMRLLIVGGGSAAFAAATRASELGAEVTIVNAGLPIGGTCVNVGCVPSKTLIRAAEAHHRAMHHGFDGLKANSSVTDFSAVIAQELELVAELRQGKYIDVVRDVPNIRILEGFATLLSDRSVEVAGETITADRLIIATGSSTFVPPIHGLEESGYLTNDTAFSLESLPESMVILGGRYIALETAQMFARFGSRVTVLQRSDRILPTESEDLTSALTGYLEDEGIRIVTGVSLQSVSRKGSTVVVEADVGGERREFEASEILVATGRKANSTGFGLEAAGVDLDRAGNVVVDDTLQTSVPGIYAAGDVLGDQMYVYAAAYEGALAAMNAVAGGADKRDYTALPWVIFTDPQVAGVGLDERQAIEQGNEVDVTTLPLSHVPRAIAARDTRGFIRLIRDAATDQLIGARILAPEGSELLMEVALAIKFGITATQLKESFHPYLTLGEGIKLATITFGKDVAKLSCCAT